MFVSFLPENVTYRDLFRTNIREKSRAKDVLSFGVCVFCSKIFKVGLNL